MSMSQVGSGLPRLLAERYELSEQVATGGMTSVWRGHDRVLGRDVVVKVLHPELAADERFRARFHEEAVNAARLTHPNIVALYDTGEQGDIAYIVMELVNGPTLGEALGRHGPLPPSRAARLAREVAAALDYAHEAGVCHGSLRPGNILLADDGTVKVADFSIARAVTDDDPGRTGEVLGVDGYLAPEVARGDVADGRADVYGLGACLYEMLTGRPPGADPVSTIPPRALRAGVPRDLDTIVRQAMGADPADRFQTVQAMAAALSRSAAGADGAPAGELLEVPPAPTGPEVTPTRGFLRHEGRLLGWTLALVAVAAVLVVVGLTLASNDLSNLFGEDGPRGTATPPTNAAGGGAVRGVEGTAYDPLGDGEEHDEDASNAVDGDNATVWQTDRYRSANLGGLKNGVGFVLTLDSPEQARQLNLNLTAAGADLSVLATDNSAIPGTIEGWQELATVPDADQQVSVKLTGGPQRHYLLWFTDLPPAGGGYRIGIAEAGLRS
jgi:tRNA A-37 threonylcarbamoyl transferase component Bud32